jgi:hypothetical protein
MITSPESPDGFFAGASCDEEARWLREMINSLDVPEPTRRQYYQDSFRRLLALYADSDRALKASVLRTPSDVQDPA